MRLRRLSLTTAVRRSKLQLCVFLGAQDTMERLSKNRSGQLGTELDLLGNFIRGQMASAVRDKVVGRDLARRHDERLDGFAAVHRSHSDDCDFAHMQEGS